MPDQLVPVALDEGDELILESIETSDGEPLPPRSRREARETSLVLLYEAEMRQVPLGEVLDAQIVAPLALTRAALAGVAEHLADIDALVQGALEHWKLARLSVIDRSLLRLGAWELRFRPDVPASAVLSEFVELAARYSTADSSRFVNGVLARLAAAERPGEV